MFLACAQRVMPMHDHSHTHQKPDHMSQPLQALSGQTFAHALLLQGVGLRVLWACLICAILWGGVWWALQGA